jgi:hypothetical protein
LQHFQRIVDRVCRDKRVARQERLQEAESRFAGRNEYVAHGMHRRRRFKAHKAMIMAGQVVNSLKGAEIAGFKPERHVVLSCAVEVAARVKPNRGRLA